MAKPLNNGDKPATKTTRQPPRAQVAAVCYRREGKDLAVLLITSRDTGRWIVPKGWPIKGLSNREAAAQEAWEEAGVQDASVSPRPIGSFRYEKGLDEGVFVPVRAEVYKLRVKKLSEEYPESTDRERIWVSPEVAADMVGEKGLRKILLRL